MKKNIFYWAFLVVAGMSLTACSSGDDNIADNTTPVTPGSQNKTVILTGTIGIGGDEATRAVDDDGKTSWTVGDKIAIIYESTSPEFSTAQGEIKSVSSDGHYATFEAALTNPKDNGNIGFAYPYDNVDMDPSTKGVYGFTFNYDAYATQNGATTGTNSISDKRLDYACTEQGGEVKMAVDGSTAKLKGNALLKNQFSMFEFTLVKEDETSTEVPATKLQIFIKSGSSFSNTADYTVTPTAATSKFYVALEPTADNATIEGVKIVASFNNQDAAKKLDADGVDAMTTDDVKNFICVDESEGTNQYQAYIYPSLTTPKVCEHTYGESKFVKGKLYSKKLTVKDLTARAVVAHVGAVSGYWSKFIALALEDVSNSGVTTAATSATLAQNWADGKAIKIGTTTYDDMYNQNYDEVIPNVNTTEGTPGITGDYSPSKTHGGDADKGWRIPSVTDWRYVIANLGGTGARSATDPAGIGDHNFYYPGNTTETGARYSALTVDDKINEACGNSNLKGQFYWTSSYYNYNAVQKAWRYSFEHHYFIWTSNEDNSMLRAVFAY